VDGESQLGLPVVERDVGPAEPAGRRRADDDMVDDPGDLGTGRPLGELLILCRDTVGAAYLRADRAAIRHQRMHRLITIFATLFGTLAILLAVIQLSHLIQDTWPLSLEVIATVVALVSVGLGLVASQQVNWLLERHRAERCRLLKFRFLIDPGLWRDEATRQARIDRLRADLVEVERLNRAGLHHWIEDDELPLLPEIDPDPIRDEAAFRDLLAYYQRKRLGVQAQFFADRARRNVRPDTLTRHLPTVLFFGSVIAALGHFAVDIVTGDHGEGVLSRLLIVLAVVLAVVGAGVRTFRGAHEFARNTNRFRAKALALSHVADKLRRETEPPIIVRDLWFCEQILEAEHREWLRLMIDAEWFG
jgi:hypothetical protein